MTLLAVRKETRSRGLTIFLSSRLETVCTYYVYQHIRPDTGAIFYVGLGKEGTKRSKSNSGRNKHWHNVVAKNNGNYTIEFVARDLSKHQAVLLERKLIAELRKCTEGGCLVNVLDGGQLQDIGPNAARTWSDDVKHRMSLGHMGNPSNTGRVCITNGSESTYVPKGTPLPEGWWYGGKKRGKYPKEFGERLSKSKKGLRPTLSAEQRAAKSARFLGNKLGLGKIWITNGAESQLIEKELSIPEGWRRGRHHITNPTGKNSRTKNKQIKTTNNLNSTENGHTRPQQRLGISRAKEQFLAA